MKFPIHGSGKNHIGGSSRKTTKDGEIMIELIQGSPTVWIEAKGRHDAVATKVDLTGISLSQFGGVSWSSPKSTKLSFGNFLANTSFKVCWDQADGAPQWNGVLYHC